MKKPTVCLIFGGKSNEYEVSLHSAFAVASHIDKEKYEVLKLGITKEGEWYLFDGDERAIFNDTARLGRTAEYRALLRCRA